MVEAQNWPMCWRSPVVSKSDAIPERAAWNKLVPYPDATRPHCIKILLAGLPPGEWRNLNLFRKSIGGWEIGVVVYEDTANDEYQIAWRRDLLRLARHLSVPTRSRDEIVSRLGTRSALADVSENSVVRSSELHAVIAARHFGHMQDLRSVPQVQYAGRRKCVMVHAGSCQLCGRGWRVERIRKNRLRFGGERIDRDWTFKPFGENRPLVQVEKNARPKIDDEEPYRDRDRTKYEQIPWSHIKLL